MRELNNEEIDRIGEFLINAYIDIPDNSVSGYNVREFSLRWHDFIEAYGGCPYETAEIYTKAKRLAIKTAQDIFRSNRYDKSIWDAVYKNYREVMTNEFFQKFIQYRWQKVSQYKNKTSVMSQSLYTDFLEAQNIDEYMDFRKETIDISLQT